MRNIVAPPRQFAPTRASPRAGTSAPVEFPGDDEPPNRSLPPGVSTPNVAQARRAGACNDGSGSAAVCIAATCAPCYGPGCGLPPAPPPDNAATYSG